MNPIYVALDCYNFDAASKLINQLRDRVGGFKIGLELWNAIGGVDGYNKLFRDPSGQPSPNVFLDLKLHDIPNTVGKTLTYLMDHLDPAPIYINVHALGGGAMMERASQVLSNSINGSRTKLVAVTILTSLDQKDLEDFGYEDCNVNDVVSDLARLAYDSGARGLVCSPKEVTMLRKIMPDNVDLLVPGIRPVDSATQDQYRVGAPKTTYDTGATVLVIGRPITEAADPVATADAILKSLCLQ